MSAREIKSTQLRALLLLLVLVPLIPTALMIRFMLDAMEDKREVVLDNLGALYQQTLAKADESFRRHLENRASPVTPREVHTFYRSLLDREAFIRVTTREGRPLTGVSLGPRPVIAQTSLQALDLPWLVQVHLLDERRPDELVREQFRVTTWTIGALIVSIFAIAAATAWTVNQQFALRELRSTAVATVAHELRTPLASMRLLVETLLAGRYRSDEQLQEYLGLIATENQRLSRLTENFLTFARLDSRKDLLAQERVVAAEVAEQVVELLGSRLHAEGCAFTCEIQPDLPEIRGDRDAVVTVLLNLLENALKYTPEKKKIALLVTGNQEAVSFAVVDNGPGLAPAEQRRVLEPFYQVDRKLSRTGGGCGLGLSIVNRIVKAHGGKLRIDSSPGRGSIFTVAIPAAPSSSPAWKQS